MAVATAVLLAVCCWMFAVFALWPSDARHPGVGDAVAELVAVALLGLGAAALVRWALDRQGRRAVALTWLLGLAPCVLVMIELLGR